jgi:hypothetical protein
LNDVGAFASSDDFHKRPCRAAVQWKNSEHASREPCRMRKPTAKWRTFQIIGSPQFSADFLTIGKNRSQNAAQTRV